MLTRNLRGIGKVRFNQVGLGGIFELWRIAGKEFDRDRFVAVLERFPHKVLERNPQQNLTASDVIRYLSAADQQYDDLLFWRD